MLHAHSAFRFLVLGVGIAAFLVNVMGLVQKKPEYGKLPRGLGSAFIGLTHLQILTGFVLLYQGLYTPKLIGHIVMMAVSVVVMQVLHVKNKNSTTPGFKLPLIGTGLALLLMVGGTFAIGRHPFQATVFGG
ncbi:MAG: hypothetical protein Q8S33_12995 [Myxococcales bacterium]|nr:hypothetical protein [Myxococcales bacterium]